MSNKKKKIIDTVHDSWKPLIQKHLASDEIRYVLKLMQAGVVPTAPALVNIFRAYTIPKEKVRIVFVGLAPYHTQFTYRGKPYRHATGIGMGIPKFCPTLTPTLRELETAVAEEWATGPYKIDRTLESWHDQGIMSLNASLSIVRNAQAPGLHAQFWKPLIKETIESLENAELFVYLGANARYFDKYTPPMRESYALAHPVKYMHTGSLEDRLAGSGVFYTIKRTFPDIVL